MRFPFVAVAVAFFIAHESVAVAATGPSIDHQQVKKAPANAPLEIRARILSNTTFGIFNPVVYLRIAGVPTFSRLPMKPVDGLADIYAATVPANVTTGPFDYYIESFDEDGNGPSRFHSAEDPVHVEIEAAGHAQVSAPPILIVAPPSDAPVAAPTQVAPQVTAPAPSSSKVPVIVAAGAGGAVTVIGAIILVSGLRDFSAWKSPADNHLSSSKLTDLHHTSNTEITLGAVLTGVGLSALGATAYLAFKGDLPAVSESDSRNPKLSSLVFDFDLPTSAARLESVEGSHE